MDVITAKKTADAVVKTLSNCRNEESFTQMWSHADVTAQKIRIGIDRLQGLTKDYFRITVYYTSIDKVVSELQSRFEGNDQEVLVYSAILQASTASKLYQISMAWIVKCYQVRSQSLKTTTAGTHAREKTQP